MDRKGTILLIHGLGGSRANMWPIAAWLEKSGYPVQHWTYRSIGNRIETHATRLTRDLLELDRRSDGHPVHLVTHSMGGIIVRAALARPETRLQNAGRLVMLAPPHHGSPVARKMTRWLGWLTPSLDQLSDRPDSYVNQLPDSLSGSGFELGIIEAARDRVIVPGTTRLPGCAGFARLDLHHHGLTWSRRSLRLISAFIGAGRFPSTSPAGASESVRPATDSWQLESSG